LPEAALGALYSALVHSYLSYCLIRISCASNVNIHKNRQNSEKSHTYNFKPTIFGTYSTLIQVFKYFAVSVTYYLFLTIFYALYNYRPKSFDYIWKYNSNCNITQNLRNADQVGITLPRIEMYKKNPLVTHNLNCGIH
jgi:hypothetical protein